MDDVITRILVEQLLKDPELVRDLAMAIYPEIAEQVKEDSPRGGRWMTWPQVCEATGIGRTKLTEMIKAGKFPAPLRPFGGVKNMFARKDVERYQENEERGGCLSLSRSPKR